MDDGCCILTLDYFFSRPKIVIGTLKGYDPLLNLVLDETEECLRGMGNEHVNLTTNRQQSTICFGTRFTNMHTIRLTCYLFRSRRTLA